MDTKDIIEPKTVIIQIDYHAWGTEVDKYINEEKSALITAKDALLLRQAEELQDKKAELQWQAEELRVKNETVLRQADELQSKDIELQRQAEKLRSKDTEIYRLSQELQAKYDELIRKAQEQQVKNAELLKLQAEILFLGDKMKQRDEHISDLQQKLKKAEALVDYFEHDKKVKEAIIISLNNRCIETLKGKYEILSGLLNEKELAIETLQQDIEHLKNINQSLENQERQKDAFINVLENSLSLKLGRSIGGIVKAPMHIFQKRIKD
jgi:chromosome segregation ATPase